MSSFIRAISCFLLLSAAVLPFSPSALAQTLTISNLTISASVDLSSINYGITVNGSGSATVSPGGDAKITFVAKGINKDLGCSLLDQNPYYATFTFANGDTLILQGLLTGQNSPSQPLNVAGGTGAYNGKGGSGTATILATQQSPISFVFTGTGSVTLNSSLKVQPTIFGDGAVPIFNSVPAVQPGSWFSIYGANLATTTAVWNGDFPKTLAGTTVTVNGKQGYLWFVTPGQINVQAPDDTTSGCVAVVVSTPNGSATGGVLLEPQSPSFNLWADAKHAVGIIYTSSGYDLLAPPGSVTGAVTRAAKAGETISLYGVGFGPTQNFVPAGQVYSPTGPNAITKGLSVTIGGKVVQASAYLVGAGLYQLNIVIPQGLGTGDQAVLASLAVNNPISQDNIQTQNAVYVPLQ